MFVSVKIYSWESACFFESGNISLEAGDFVIIEKDGLLEWGRVEEIKKEKDDSLDKSVEKILRKANTSDLETIEHYKEKRVEAIKLCREGIKKYDLPMKLVDAKFSFDGSRIIFAFTADGRVDFRELVKDLSRHFQRSIRLQQVGSRDQARRLGLFGPCGRELCCRNFQRNNLESISTRAVYLQRLVHRGNERLSGVCGRLMCCLNFEMEQYEKMRKGIPNIDENVRTPEGKGKVVEISVLSQRIEVELENGNKKYFPVKEIKKF